MYLRESRILISQAQNNRAEKSFALAETWGLVCDSKLLVCNSNFV